MRLKLVIIQKANYKLFIIAIAIIITRMIIIHLTIVARQLPEPSFVSLALLLSRYCALHFWEQKTFPVNPPNNPSEAL